MHTRLDRPASTDCAKRASAGVHSVFSAVIGHPMSIRRTDQSGDALAIALLCLDVDLLEVLVRLTQRGPDDPPHRRRPHLHSRRNPGAPAPGDLGMEMRHPACSVLTSRPRPARHGLVRARILGGHRARRGRGLSPWLRDDDVRACRDVRGSLDPATPVRSASAARRERSSVSSGVVGRSRARELGRRRRRRRRDTHPRQGGW